MPEPTLVEAVTGLQSDLDQLRAANRELEMALRYLVAEVTGLVGFAEAELRDIYGHTNVNVLIRKLAAARIALAKVEGD